MKGGSGGNVPKSAGDMLRQLVREVGQSRRRSAYCAALDDILPPHQRERCQVVGFRDGKLTLEVSSAPLFAELSGFRREEIRLRINEAVDGFKVAELQFRLGGTGHV
jgi:hypothetical protein